MNFQYFLFNQLPTYFKSHDSYKDGNDRGFIERYLEIFGLELDEFYVDKLVNFLDIRDPYTADITNPSFLNYLSFEKGLPPDLWDIPDIYRTVVAFVHRINLMRGSCESYKVLFRALNLEITLDEIVVPDIRWDDGTTWDQAGANWDTNCAKCHEYRINFHYIKHWEPVDNTIIDADLQALLLKLICWIQPVQSKFTGEFVFDGTVYPAMIDFKPEDFESADFA